MAHVEWGMVGVWQVFGRRVAGVRVHDRCAAGVWQACGCMIGVRQACGRRVAGVRQAYTFGNFRERSCKEKKPDGEKSRN